MDEISLPAGFAGTGNSRGGVESSANSFTDSSASITELSEIGKIQTGLPVEFSCLSNERRHKTNTERLLTFVFFVPFVVKNMSSKIPWRVDEIRAYEKKRKQQAPWLFR